MIDMNGNHDASSSERGIPALRIRDASAKVVLIDDQPLVRYGLRTILSRNPDFEVAAEAGSFGEGLEACVQSRPSLVVLEVVLREGNGLELIRQLSTRVTGAQVLVCSMHDESLYAERALRAGARGFVSKFQPVERVVEALRRILDGRVYLSDFMTDRMLYRTISGHGDGEKSPVETLSDRELEVFVQLGNGVTTRQIAQNLSLSPKTIETYRENIKAKLNLRNGMELTQHAVQWVLENRQTDLRPAAVH